MACIETTGLSNRHRVDAEASSAANILKAIESAWVKVASRRVFSCLLVVAVSMAGRLALLRVDPKPQPRVHDEFAYLLGAETLAKGHLANPTHPLWRFFETYHINMQPTYVSKYPPAQSAFMALGIRLFGHPWYGVLLSVALMCGCVCWMLQGWLPPKYALLGGLLAFLQFGLAHYWIDSYWGGAVGAMGGALVFGALPRLARDGKASAAFAGAIGIAILANSRPWEGLILVALTSVALVWWTRNRFYVWLRPAVLFPFAAVMLTTAGGMAYYNFETTGSLTTFPYSVNQNRYAVSPVLWIMPLYESKNQEYRDPSMRDFWQSWDLKNYTRIRQNPLRELFHLYDAFRDFVGGGAGIILVFSAACAVPLARIPRLRIALGVLLVFVCAMTVDKYVFAHYLAPGLGVFFVVAMFGLRLLRCHRLGGQPTGLVLISSIVALAGIVSVSDTTRTILYPRPQSMDYPDVDFRRTVAARLESEAGPHLVLVRYAGDHVAHDEIIYNSPDIDSQKIVWAFDFGREADRPLIDYYSNRKVWLVQPDGPSPTIELYSGN
jgi:hypothetical protein